jgi:tripartite-type tricarboxylate transporter receptor subunit TctC
MIARTGILPLTTGLAALAGAFTMGTSAIGAEFYAGKTIDIVVSSDTGGGYDTYSRLLARHLSQHVPGKPSIVVQNMPGGGGLRSAQYVYNAAPKDGTALGNIRASTMLDAALGIRGGKIDPTKYEWVGSLASDTDVCSFWHTAGIHKFEDLKKKEVVVGASGKSAQNFSFTNAINNVLGTKMKIVLGYKGAADRILALERGELQGNCGINGSTLASSWPQLIAEKKLIPVVQSGLKPYTAFAKVPLTQSFAKTDEQKKILNTIFSQMDVARTYAFPPGTPKARVTEISKAFVATTKDPKFLADAKKVKVDIDIRSGEDVNAIMRDMMELPAELKKKVRTAIGS